MGTFLIYHLAGGEAGMRHFMAQFGPTLQLPWTKLADVPELDDELLDTLVARWDAQAAGRSIEELARVATTAWWRSERIARPVVGRGRRRRCDRAAIAGSPTATERSS